MSSRTYNLLAGLEVVEVDVDVESVCRKRHVSRRTSDGRVREAVDHLRVETSHPNGVKVVPVEEHRAVHAKCEAKLELGADVLHQELGGILADRHLILPRAAWFSKEVADRTAVAVDSGKLRRIEAAQDQFLIFVRAPLGTAACVLGELVTVFAKRIRFRKRTDAVVDLAVTDLGSARMDVRVIIVAISKFAVSESHSRRRCACERDL